MWILNYDSLYTNAHVHDHKVKYLGDLALGSILEIFIFAHFSHDSFSTVHKCTTECTSIGLK